MLVSLPIAFLGCIDIDHDRELSTQVNFAFMVLRPLTFFYSIMMFIIFVNLIKFFKKRRQVSRNSQIDMFLGKKKKKNNDKRVMI